MKSIPSKGCLLESVRSSEKACPKVGHLRIKVPFSRAFAVKKNPVFAFSLDFLAFSKVGTALALLKTVMNKITTAGSQPRGFQEETFGSVQGSVLMEYVLVQVLIACVLMLFTTELVYSHTNGFGPLGLGICHFYQRILGGLSLPTP